MTTAEKLIQAFGLEKRTDEYTDHKHADLWSGSGVSPSISYADDGIVRVRKLLPEGTQEMGDWSDWPYRVVWRIPSERVHVTYCEGDLSVLVARSLEDLFAIDRSAEDYYARDIA